MIVVLMRVHNSTTLCLRKQIFLLLNPVRFSSNLTDL